MILAHIGVVTAAVFHVRTAYDVVLLVARRSHQRVRVDRVLLQNLQGAANVVPLREVV